MTRLAVTGARGFVGRTLVARLRRDGIAAVAISRGNGAPHDDGGVRTAEVDYADVARLAELFANCDAVIHLAARAHQIGETVDADTARRYREANVAPVLAVAQAAQRAGVRRVVLVSSIGVNGNATHGHPFTEADPPAPAEPYAVSKLEAELTLQQALADGATDWVVLRPPLVYGPGCPGNLAKLIGLTARAPLLPLGDLHAPRTLVAIDNLLDALQVASLHDAASRRTFVVADGRDIDVASMLRAFLDGLGRGRWRLLPVPAGLLGALARAAGKGAAWTKISGALQVDARAFGAATGWRPHVDPVDGLRAAAAAFSRFDDA